MFKTTLMTAMTAGLIATSANALTDVGGVDVTVDLDAIKNTEAAEHWNQISVDMKLAIEERIADLMTEDGASVTVDIDEVSLANAFQSTYGIEDSTLVGDVSVQNLNDNTDFDKYKLTVTYDHANKFFPTATGGTILSKDSEEYYEGMVAAFADMVSENLRN